MDLNADLGEGIGDDAALLDVVTSANIACGGHAGDEASMRCALTLAAERGVTVGAHVSYPDRPGFGRTRLDLPPERLAATLAEQLAALSAQAAAIGVRVRYLKPHGALYHEAGRDPAHARVVAELALAAGLPLLLAPGALAVRLTAAAGLPGHAEAFADRGYTPDGGLLPRGEPGAVVHDAAAVADRVREFLRTATMPTPAGRVPVPAVSLCVHGDTPGAVGIARAVRAVLEAEGAGPAPFLP